MAESSFRSKILAFGNIYWKFVIIVFSGKSFTEQSVVARLHMYVFKHFQDSFIDKQASMLWEGILRRLDGSLGTGLH